MSSCYNDGIGTADGDSYATAKRTEQVVAFFCLSAAPARFGP
ncbi:MAG: hypothetical protein WCB27_20565 [Thermoguttaceae bacterium]